MGRDCRMRGEVPIWLQDVGEEAACYVLSGRSKTEGYDTFMFGKLYML